MTEYRILFTEDGVRTKGLKAFLRKIARMVLKAHGIDSPCEISVLLVGDDRMKELNREYRKLDEPTDVLSFPLQEGFKLEVPEEEPTLLGDIVISLDTAHRQAQEQKHSFEHELAELLTHGILHLLGYDDETQEGLERMKSYGDELLARINLQALLSES